MGSRNSPRPAFSNKWAKPVLGALLVVALVWPALLNGFPIVYSDTGTYISSGFHLETPSDRPITYGLFVWLFSFGGLTLWSVVVAQAMLVLFVLDRLLDAIGRDFPRRTSLVVTVLVLSAFSSLPWLVSQVMPDLFTALLFLVIALILSGTPSRSEKVGYHVLFTFCVAVHLSHPTMVIALLVLLTVFRRRLVRASSLNINYRNIAWLLLLTVSTIPIMGSALSKSRNIFFMGAMVEHGVAGAYLEEHCKTRSFTLCKYRASLPAKAYDFIWSANGPVELEGGWRVVDKEYGEIILGTLSDPYYIKLHLLASVRATLAQLRAFDIGDGWGVFLQGSTVDQAIADHLPRELDSYRHSRQNRGMLRGIDLIARVHAVSVLLTLLVMATILWRSRSNTHPIKLLIVVAMSGILVNAWCSGTFGGAIDRLGCKTIWLIPLLTVWSFPILWRQNTGGPAPSVTV